MAFCCCCWKNGWFYCQPAKIMTWLIDLWFFAIRSTKEIESLNYLVMDGPMQTFRMNKEFAMEEMNWGNFIGLLGSTGSTVEMHKNRLCVDCIWASRGSHLNLCNFTSFGWFIILFWWNAWVFLRKCLLPSKWHFFYEYTFFMERNF